MRNITLMDAMRISRETYRKNHAFCAGRVAGAAQVGARSRRQPCRVSKKRWPIGAAGDFFPIYSVDQPRTQIQQPAWQQAQNEHRGRIDRQHQPHPG